MTEIKQDALARAYARLTALRKNIGEMTAYSITEAYVHEFHAVLDKLEDVGVGVDVNDFRIPDSEVNPRIIASWEGGERYSDEKYVERSFILIKLDSVLGYFEIITSEKPREIGYPKPEK